MSRTVKNRSNEFFSCISLHIHQKQPVKSMHFTVAYLHLAKVLHLHLLSTQQKVNSITGATQPIAPSSINLLTELQADLSRISTGIQSLSQYITNPLEFPGSVPKASFLADSCSYVFEEHVKLVVSFLRTQLVTQSKLVADVLSLQSKRERQIQREFSKPIIKEHKNTAVEIEIPTDGQNQSLLFTTMLAEPVKRRGFSFETVESSVHELGGMFQQLAHMISQQHDSLQRIDRDVEDLSINVERGGLQIDKFLQMVRSDRRLLIKMFIAVALILFLWIKFFK